MVFCGSLKSLGCSHVVVKNYVYDFSDPIDSVNFLYQLFFVLNIEYPFASTHIWSFLQKNIFRMEKNERKIYGNTQIKDLMAKLENVNV